MKTPFNILLFGFLIVITGCSSLTLRPADFSWPVEVVVKPDARGVVQAVRYQMSINVKALFFDELQDSTSFAKHQVRMIRDQSGYYFITAKGFKDVYVFSQGVGSLSLEKKILVDQKGLEAPAFNQKSPNIELVNENNENEPPIILSKDGIREGVKK